MNITRRTALAALAGFISPLSAFASPTLYRLDTRESSVGFRFILNGAEQKGTMPVRSAKILIDPENLAASRVDVSVNVRGARTPYIFATKALIGPSVLNAARFPIIRFISQRITLAPDGRLSGGARITGQLTIRDETRTVTLDANLYRAPGSAPQDLSELQIRLTGLVKRSDFGATGYPNLVRDAVVLDIFALLRSP